jgi:predicted nucleic acid-binding protein
MNTFVDTSAFYALASSSDEFHDSAKKTYQRLLYNDEQLVTTSYILPLLTKS